MPPFKNAVAAAIEAADNAIWAWHAGGLLLTEDGEFPERRRDEWQAVTVALNAIATAARREALTDLLRKQHKDVCGYQIVEVFDIMDALIAIGEQGGDMTTTDDALTAVAPGGVG